VVGTHCRNSYLWLIQMSRLASKTDAAMYSRQQIMNSSARLKLASGPAFARLRGILSHFETNGESPVRQLLTANHPTLKIEFQQCGNELLAFLLVAA
jgi:hypothetical protein